MKRWFYSLLLAIVLVTLVALPVFAAVYRASLTITEENGNAYTMLPIMTTSNNDWLADNGFMDADALDTRVQTLAGANQPHMVTEDTTLTAIPVPAYSQTNLYFITDQTPAASMDIITGYGGYFTIPDAAALEFANDFESEFSGYVDTSASAVGNNLVYKEEAFRTYVSAVDEISSAILTTATFYPDPNVEVTSVDGWVTDNANNMSWANLIIEPGSNFADNGASGYLIYIKSDGVADQWDDLLRSCFLFDTSSIPDGSVIISATLSIYGSGKADNLTITPNINVYSSAPASDTALANGDFDSLGTTAYCDTPVTYGDWNVAGYNDFELNTAGLAVIDDTGITKLGLRNANYDVSGTPPAWGNTLDSYLQGYFADEPLTTKDPRLVVVYGAPEDTVTATSVSTGDIVVNTYGVANELAWATGNVLNFDGTATGNINCGAIYNTSANLWISFRFRLDSQFDSTEVTNQEIFFKQANGTNWIHCYLDPANGQLRVDKFTGGAFSGRLSINPPEAGTPNYWAADKYYHILWSISAVNGTRFLLDGALEDDDPDNSAICNGGNFYIGEGLFAAGGFIGEIVNFVTGTDNLTGGEETDLYNGTAPGDEVDYWYIDEGTGNTIYSYGTGANNGTRGAGTTWQTSTYTTGETGRPCDFYIDVDGDRWGTNLKGTSVPGNANNWIIANMPSMDYYQHTVGGTLIAWYQPNDIIAGTVLPDRQGVAQNATITWGANPAGITSSFGSMVSAGQPSLIAEIETEPRDVLPGIGTSDWYGDGTVTKATTLANPARPFVTAISTNTTLSEIQVWRLFGLALLLLVVVATAASVKQHQGITAIIAGVALGGLIAFDNNIFPLYLLVLAIGMFVGGIIAERSPSV